MAWIESHQDLERHPKTGDLMAAMSWDLDTCLGKLHRFWYWCVDYAEDGDLTRHNDNRIALAMGVALPDAKRVVEAMVKACWLDREPYFRVHDWWDYFGKFLQIKYKNSPEKWQAVREAYKNGSNNGSNNGCENHIPNRPNQPNLTNQPNSEYRSDSAPKLTGEGKSLVHLVSLCREVLGERELTARHKRWLDRATENAAKLNRVLAEVRCMQTEKRIKTSPAQTAEDLWKRWT